MARSTVDELSPQTRRLQPWVLVLSILGAAMATAEIISGSMMPLMATGLNTTEGMVGQAVTASAIVAIITSLSIGKIAGNHDRRKIMIVLTLFLIASNFGIAIAPNVWFMLASRLLLGAAIGIIWGLIPATVLRLAPKGQFARSFSTVMIGVAVASVIGAPLAAYVGAAISWRVVYAAATGLAVLALVLMITTFPPLPARPGVLDRDLRGTLRLPGLISGMAGIMLLFGGAQAFFGYMVPFLESVTGLGANGISVALLLTGLCGMAGTMLAPKSLGRSIYGVMVAAPAAMAVLLGALQIGGHIVAFALAVLMVWSFARAHIGVGANAWIAHNFSEQAEGAGGILVAVIQGSMMLGAILGGLLIDNIGANAPPAAGAIILSIGAVYCFFAMRPRSLLTTNTQPVALQTPTSGPIEVPTPVTDELA